MGVAGVTMPPSKVVDAAQVQALLQAVQMLAVDPLVAVTPSVDAAYWDALYVATQDDNSTENVKNVLAEVGIYVAGMASTAEQIVGMLRTLLTHKAFEGVGALGVVRFAFRGLKVTKRWNVLEVASHELIDAVFDKCVRAALPVQIVAMQFYMEILVGYQHKADLYVQKLPQIVQLVHHVAEYAKSEVEDGVVKDLVVQNLVTACYAMAHCHRAYEEQAQQVRRALEDAFGAAVTPPTAKARDAALRECAWILPATEMTKFLAPIEGKWVLDEISSEQHHPASSVQTNAGSVLLKTEANCLAVDVSGEVQGSSTQNSISLDGYFHKEMKPGATWQLDGHWSQVLSTTTQPTVAMAPQSVAWSCPACTLNNEPDASKCATCGTAAPSSSVPAATRNGAAQSNPAPFVATFSPDLSFMHIRWTRGEQQGVWLAKNLSEIDKFAISTEFERLSPTERQGKLTAKAYSPLSRFENVLVLQKPLSLFSNEEFAVQVWIQPVAGGPSRQTILANAECELYMLESGAIVWDIFDGLYTLKTQALPHGSFSHVTIQATRDHFQLLVDEMVVEESMRSVANESSSGFRVGPFTIGGRSTAPSGPVSSSTTIESCFAGVILDLRVWTRVIVPPSKTSTSLSSSLHGSEQQLLAYLPLVGDSERVLLDMTANENHATVFGAINGNLQSFAPNASLVALPVNNVFTRSLGSFCTSGVFSGQPNGLGVHVHEVGAALWCSNALDIASGFESSVWIEPVVPARTCEVVFALTQSSYWKMSPLQVEASMMDRSSETGLSEDNSLFVKCAFVADDSVFTRCNISVVVWRNKRPNVISRACRIACSSVMVRIKQVQPAQTLCIELGDGVVCFECAINLQSALDLKVGGVRAGLVFPLSAESHDSSSASMLLREWTFNKLAPSTNSDDSGSVLENVYPSLCSKKAEIAREAAAVSTSETTGCTRCSTDGSAIEQETYGCQTCNLVHGAALCRVCTSICHEGHEIVAMGLISSVCACHLRPSGSCQSMSAVRIDDHPVLQSPVKATLWCCSKCTVINEAASRECSVCGNKTPTQPATSEQQSSSSRAIVERKDPPVEPTQWTCEACTMLNEPNASKCFMCETPRPASAGSDTSGKDGLLTLYHAAEGSSMQVEPARASDAPWFCSACTMENKGSDSSCYMCSTVRDIPVAGPIEAADTVLALPSSRSAEQVATVAQPAAVNLHDRSRLENAQRLEEFMLSLMQADLTAGVGRNLSIGHWDSTAGSVSFTVGAPFMAKTVSGNYVEQDGTLCGIARLTSDGKWKLDGRYKKHSQTQENAFSITWDTSASRFDGRWYRGDGSGEWKCVVAPASSDFRGLAKVSPTSSQRQPFYSGLINMKQNLTNVCYQNSFLQPLFMTEEFRKLVLSCRTEDFPAIPTEDESNGDVLRCIQDLFARLTASQRAELDSHALQRCLPSTFQAGRQQDTSDFAHFVIDALTQQLSQREDTIDSIADIFGGQQATVLACKECGKKSVNREYFWELLLNMIDLKYTPITDITAVSGSSTDIATPAGFERINNDLNKDRSSAPYVFLCVKRCPEQCSASQNPAYAPITDLIIRTVPFTDPKPTMSGYERVEMDLNSGGSTVVIGGKKQVYLFFKRDPDGSPITDLQVIVGNENVPDGFKQIRIDLNQGEGSKVFLCYRCDMPITDLKIVNNGIPGYKLVDHLLNLSHEDAIKQYMALKVGGTEQCVTDLKLVEGASVPEFVREGWELTGSPSSTSYMEHDGPPSQLMVRRGHGNPIYVVDVFRAPREVPKYKDYEVIDIYPGSTSVNTSTSTLGEVAQFLKGDWVGNEEIDRARKSVRISTIKEPLRDAILIKGSFDDGGELIGVAFSVHSAWSQAVTAGDESTSRRRILQLQGFWRSSKIKQPQLVNIEIRQSHLEDGMYSFSGVLGDGRSNPVTVNATQKSARVRTKWPISSLYVIRGDERVPDGVEVVRETVSGRTGNLLAQTQSPYSLYLAVKREENPVDDAYLTDVCVIYGEIDAVPEDYVCVQTTPGGFSANLNDGTSGVPIFICYHRGKSKTEKSLIDLALAWSSGAQADATVPQGFTKVLHTPLGMDANLNQGTRGVAIHLCFAKCDPAHIARPLSDGLNGEYEVSAVGNSSPANSPSIFRFLTMSVMEKLEGARVIEGRFGTVLHAHLPGSLRGVLFRSAQKNSTSIIGLWSSEEQVAGTDAMDFASSMFPFEFTVGNNSDLDGWWSGPQPSQPSAAVTTTATLVGGPWKLVKDSYVRVAFKRDYGTEWKNGKLLSSERVWRHDIATMLSRFVAKRTLGGDNVLSCSDCQRKTESRAHTVIVSPPKFLILTIKRMYYDWVQQKTCKCLHDVQFPAHLVLPSLDADDEGVLYTEQEEDRKKRDRKRHYGLYGALVHSGMTANSGHYYSFCRESSDIVHQLHLEESTQAPWIKFNDSKVELSSWKEMNQQVSNSMSDSVYLLLYKKLSYDPPEVTAQGIESDIDMASSGHEDEEAMLLAKAMALSMSAASQSKQTSTENAAAEEKATSACEDMNVARPADLRILKQVEQWNADFMETVLSQSSSALHATDLHTLMALRHGLVVAPLSASKASL